jgi:putative transcriptional regulator
MQPMFLIASPHKHDPLFDRTVVLVWHHDREGAVGVVVNRHLKHRLDDVVDLDRAVGIDRGGLDPYRDVPVAWGGPMENTTGTVVTVGALTSDEGWVLPNGIGITRSQEAMLRLLREQAPLMLCLGYAGWSAGQLDREIELGGWLWTDCDVSLLFDTPPEERYDKALASLGLTAATVWMQPINE